MENDYIKKESDDLNLAIGAKIRARRIKRGFSIEQLATMVGLSSPFIGLIERGSRGTQLINLVKICETLDLSLDEVVKKNVQTDYSLCEDDEFEVEDEARIKCQKIQKIVEHLDMPKLIFLESMVDGLLMFPYDKK